MDKVKKQFKFPHTYVILFIVIILAVAATYFIPAGEFDRVVNEATGRTVAAAGTYHRVEQSPVGLFDLFVNVQKGMINAANIIFFIFFAYGYVYMVIKTGAFYGAINKLLIIMKGKENLVIPIFMLVFGISGSTFGMFEETYGLIPVFVGLAIAMGYDAIVGMSVVGLAVATGFASATINPFTVGIAQGIAELPLFSGLSFRIVVFIAFMGLAIWYTMRYANKVKKDPKLSIVYDIDFGEMALDKDKLAKSAFTTPHKIIMIGFLLTVIVIVIGALKLGWYINEIAALFLIMTIITGFISRFNASKIAVIWLEACSGVVFGALVVGLARAVLVIMDQGKITDTIIYSLSLPLSHVSTSISACGMLVVQNLINFLIPSGSGQAATTMPIMAPLADMIGIKRQIAVLVYHFGDGYSNMLWPTAGCVVMCGIAKIPLDRWWRFFVPLFGLMFLLQIIFTLVAVAIGFGPF